MKQLERKKREEEKKIKELVEKIKNDEGVKEVYIAFKKARKSP